jgi:tetratricopeptide (TPR) repeat protein
MSFDHELANLNVTLRHDPNNESAKVAKSQLLNNRALELASENNWDEAFELLDEAIGLNSKNAIFHVNKADLLTKLGRFEESMDSASRALKIEPSNRVAKDLLSICSNNLNTIYMDAGEHEKALEKINLALEYKPNDNIELYNKAANLYKLNRTSEALEFVNKSIKADPTFGNPKVLKAIILNHQSLEDIDNGNREEALRKVNLAIELKPTEIGFHINKTVFLIEMNKIGEAKEAVEKALELDAHNKDVVHLKEVIDKKGFHYKVETPYLNYVTHSHIPHESSQAFLYHPHPHYTKN